MDCHEGRHMIDGGYHWYDKFESDDARRRRATTTHSNMKKYPRRLGPQIFRMLTHRQTRAHLRLQVCLCV
jgi:hypothetical protein